MIDGTPFDVVTEPAPKQRGANQHNGAAWPADRTEELKRRWAAGESLGVIAAAMKLSRNQIAGARDRLKLPARKTKTMLPNMTAGAVAALARHAMKKSKPKQQRNPFGQFPKKAVAAGMAAEPKPSKPPSLPPERIETTPTETRVGLLELKPGRCKWPIPCQRRRQAVRAQAEAHDVPGDGDRPAPGRRRDGEGLGTILRRESPVDPSRPRATRGGCMSIPKHVLCAFAAAGLPAIGPDGKPIRAKFDGDAARAGGCDLWLDDDQYVVPENDPSATGRYYWQDDDVQPL